MKRRRIPCQEFSSRAQHPRSEGPGSEAKRDDPTDVASPSPAAGHPLGHERSGYVLVPPLALMMPPLAEECGTMLGHDTLVAEAARPAV